MKINQVSVEYSELRTIAGSFSNIKHGVVLSATIDQGETPSAVKDYLAAKAMEIVKKQFGDNVLVTNSDPMEIPFY